MYHVAGGGGTGERLGGALRAVFTTRHAPLPVGLGGLVTQVLGPGSGYRIGKAGCGRSELGPARGVEKKPREEEWLGYLCSE